MIKGECFRRRSQSAVGRQGGRGRHGSLCRSPRSAAGLSRRCLRGGAANGQDENRALLLRYLRAWDQALRWCHDEKNRDEAIRLIAEAEKIDEKAAANRLRQSARDGRLNLPGLQSVLDLRVQFELTPPMGEDLAKYYDENLYHARRLNRVALIPKVSKGGI